MGSRFTDDTGADGFGMIADLLLWPLSLIYGLVVTARLAFYRLGLLSSTRLACKVVSVGNITTGGTGKTPVTMRIAKELKASGKKVAVVSRGYKRDSTGLGIVSDGKGVLLTPREAGDEPFLMAEKLEGIPVVVCADRVGAAKYVVSNFGTEVVVLDDGFQHVRLKRDVDIVLIDPVRGRSATRLLPRGLLREPISALARADILMIKGGAGAGALPTLPPGAPGEAFSFSYKRSALVNSDGDSEELSALKGARVAVIAGIASPASFVGSIEGAGAVIVVKKFFPDHHGYTGADIKKIEELSSSVERIITTEKDMVKLRSQNIEAIKVKLRALAIEVEIDGSEAFFGKLSLLIGKGER